MANRDLNQTERNALEALIDASNVEAVMQALSDICVDKASHLDEAWQDRETARLWNYAAGVIGVASTKLTRHVNGIPSEITGITR